MFPKRCDPKEFYSPGKDTGYRSVKSGAMTGSRGAEVVATFGIGASADKMRLEYALQSSDKAYFTGALGAMASRVITILAGVLSLWFLTRVLGTDQFAGYSVAFSALILVGYSVGLGIERSMLLRIGELAPDASALKGGRMMRAILLVAGVLASIAALVMALLYGAGDTPRHAFLRMMAPLVPATALTLVMVTWFQANHRVGVAQVMTGLNDGVRSAAFGVCFLLGLGAGGIAAGAVVGALAPLFFLTFRAAGQTQPEPSGLGVADFTAGLQFLALRLSRMGLHHLDIIALGALGTTTGTAQYAVAARFAILVESGQSMFAPTFMPRARRHLSTGRMDLAEREYHVSRVIGFAGALSLSIGFALFGEPVLQLFGSFGVGFDAFMVLVAGNLLTVGFGMHSVFLSMTDHLGRSTANRVACVAIFAVLLWFLVPRFDAVGAALAFLIAQGTHDAVGVRIMKRRLGISAFDLADCITVLAACTIFCLIGIELVPRLAGIGLLLVLLAATALRHREIMTDIASSLLRIVLRRA